MTISFLRKAAPGLLIATFATLTLTASGVAASKLWVAQDRQPLSEPLEIRQTRPTPSPTPSPSPRASTSPLPSPTPNAPTPEPSLYKNDDRDEDESEIEFEQKKKRHDSEGHEDAPKKK